MEIPDNLYDDMMTMIDTGDQGGLTDEMVEYMELLKIIHGWTFHHFSREQIITLLQSHPYNLSYYLATKRYSEAVNYFYIDVKITKSAFRNWYAEKLDRAADLVFETATSSKDIDVYKNIIYAIREFRELDVPEPDDIPDDFYKKFNKVYVLDPKLVGRKRPDRNKLAAHIDSLDIPETDKHRVKADAMIEDIELFPEEDED